MADLTHTESSTFLGSDVLAGSGRFVGTRRGPFTRAIHSCLCFCRPLASFRISNHGRSDGLSETGSRAIRDT